MDELVQLRSLVAGEPTKDEELGQRSGAGCQRADPIDAARPGADSEL